MSPWLVVIWPPPNFLTIHTVHDFNLMTHFVRRYKQTKHPMQCDSLVLFLDHLKTFFPHFLGLFFLPEDSFDLRPYWWGCSFKPWIYSKMYASNHSNKIDGLFFLFVHISILHARFWWNGYLKFVLISKCVKKSSFTTLCNHHFLMAQILALFNIMKTTTKINTFMMHFVAAKKIKICYGNKTYKNDF